MKIHLKGIVLILGVIGVCLFAAIIFAGCNQLDSYKQVTLTRAGVTFSFEYPVTFEDYYGSLEEDYEEDSVTLLHPVENAVSRVFDEAFMIDITPQGLV